MPLGLHYLLCAAMMLNSCQLNIMLFVFLSMLHVSQDIFGSKICTFRKSVPLCCPGSMGPHWGGFIAGHWLVKSISSQPLGWLQLLGRVWQCFIIPCILCPTNVICCTLEFLSGTDRWGQIYNWCCYWNMSRIYVQPSMYFCLYFAIICIINTI